MTLQDQDAEVGRVVRERHEARVRRQALIAKASKAGELLKHLGAALGALDRLPEGGRVPMRIDPQGVTVALPSGHESVTGALVTLDELRLLLEELQEVEGKLSTLNAQVKAFGI